MAESKCPVTENGKGDQWNTIGLCSHPHAEKTPKIQTEENEFMQNTTAFSLNVMESMWSDPGLQAGSGN